MQAVIIHCDKIIILCAGSLYILCSRLTYVLFPIGSAIMKVEGVVFWYECALTGSKESSLPGLTVDR